MLLETVMTVMTGITAMLLTAARFTTQFLLTPLLGVSCEGNPESRVCLNLSGGPFIKMAEDGDYP